MERTWLSQAEKKVVRRIVSFMKCDSRIREIFIVNDLNIKNTQKTPSVDNPKDVSSKELGLMNRNFNKMYSKNKFKINDHNYS